MSERLAAAGRRYARLATRAVVARPRLWPLFRPLLRRQFDALAATWEGRRGPESLAPVAVALDRVPGRPRRILDLGTGTGIAARMLAERYTDATVVGVDVSTAMLEEARRLPTFERVRYELADAARLPYEDGSFDLVVLLNMIPFFDELARVVTSGGAVVIAFSSGAQTPIYVSPDKLRRELEIRGFTQFDDVAAGAGTAVLALK